MWQCNYFQQEKEIKHSEAEKPFCVTVSDITKEGSHWGFTTVLLTVCKGNRAWKLTWTDWWLTTVPGRRVWPTDGLHRRSLSIKKPSGRKRGCEAAGGRRVGEIRPGQLSEWGRLLPIWVNPGNVGHFSSFTGSSSMISLDAHVFFFLLLTYGKQKIFLSPWDERWLFHSDLQSNDFCRNPIFPETRWK